jgi:putative spermidine/putrescine transport system ATP-binding protein
VGASNLVDGDLALRVLGRSGRFMIRPEKIRIAPANEALEPGECELHGTIRTVVYLGSQSIYLVAVSDGRTLTAVEQNINTTSTEALAQQGREVRLVWRLDQTMEVSPDASDRKTTEAEP